MKRVTIAFLMLTLIFGMAFATGSVEPAETTSGPRYPATVDPFGKYDEPITMTFALPTNEATNFPAGWDYSDNIWTQAIFDELGIRLELAFEAPDVGGQYETRVNLAIASGDVPDSIRLTSAAQFSRLVDAGRLEDLTEAFDKFAYPQLQEWFMEDGGVGREWGTVGGKLYGIAQSSVPFQTARMLFIRQDWREDLGFDQPTSMNDVIDMARAFKAVDPDNRYGFLITQDLLDNGMSDMFAIANSMEVYPRRWIDNGSGELVYGSVQPGMKDVLALYRDFYEEGLINPEFASTSGGDSAPQLTNSMVGIAPNAFWLYSWPLNSLYVSEGVEWEAYPVLPMDGYSRHVSVATDRTKREFSVVRAGYEYPEALIKVLNFETYKVNDPEGADQGFHSDDKYNYHMMMPFRPAFAPMRVNYDTHINVTAAIDNDDTSYLVQPHDFKQYDSVKAYFDAIDAGETPEASSWVAKNFFYGAESAFGVLTQYFDGDNYMISPAAGIKTDEMIRKEQTLNQMEDQYFVEIITGSRPLDDFDEFVDDWMALGGSTISDEINDWYDSIK